MEKLEPDVDVVVDLQLSDLMRANLWARYSKRSTQLSLAATVVLTILFALFVFSTLVSPAILLIPLVLLLLDLLILLAIILETRRNYSAVKDFQKQIHYHLNREGYTARDGKSSSNVSWESVSKAVESGQGINLFLGRTHFAMIPRR